MREWQHSHVERAVFEVARRLAVRIEQQRERARQLSQLGDIPDEERHRELGFSSGMTGDKNAQLQESQESQEQGHTPSETRGGTREDAIVLDGMRSGALTSFREAAQVINSAFAGAFAAFNTFREREPDGLERQMGSHVKHTWRPGAFKPSSLASASEVEAREAHDRKHFGGLFHNGYENSKKLKPELRVTGTARFMNSGRPHRMPSPSRHARLPRAKEHGTPAARSLRSAPTSAAKPAALSATPAKAPAAAATTANTPAAAATTANTPAAAATTANTPAAAATPAMAPAAAATTANTPAAAAAPANAPAANAPAADSAPAAMHL